MMDYEQEYYEEPDYDAYERIQLDHDRDAGEYDLRDPEDVFYEDVMPTCDLCDGPETCGEDDCTICPGNWDGECGVHIDCVKFEEWKNRQP